MTSEMIALARRAVASEHWRWMPGMRWINPSDLDDGGRWLIHRPRQDAVPDLSDPATLGCLLALVREAWGDPWLCVVGEPETSWRLDAVTAAVSDLHSFATEAEALVAALESAP